MTIPSSDDVDQAIQHTRAVARTNMRHGRQSAPFVGDRVKLECGRFAALTDATKNVDVIPYGTSN